MVSRKRKRNRRITRKKRKGQRGGKPPAIVFNFSGSAGFGSILNVMLHAYKYAKDSGRPFYMKDSTWDSGILHRWHDGFKNFDLYNPQVHGDQIDECAHPKFNGMRPYRYSELCDAMKDILVFKDDIVAKADEFSASIGHPYSSLYVRRGDKVHGCSISPKEMGLIPTADILKEVGIGDDGRKLFVMTDDYSVVEEIEKELPSCKVYTLTSKGNRGLAQNTISSFSMEEKRKQVNELLSSIKVFLNGDVGWSDNRSNMGRLLKMANTEKVHLYPITDHSKKLTASTFIWPSWKELGDHVREEDR
jgi:hypothetical protein